MVSSHYVDESRCEYRLDGLLHRCNGAARIWIQLGIWGWYLYGKPHRYYGPQNLSHGSWWIFGNKIK